MSKMASRDVFDSKSLDKIVELTPYTFMPRQADRRRQTRSVATQNKKSEIAQLENLDGASRVRGPRNNILRSRSHSTSPILLKVKRTTERLLS